MIQLQQVTPYLQRKNFNRKKISDRYFLHRCQVVIKSGAQATMEWKRNYSTNGLKRFALYTPTGRLVSGFLMLKAFFETMSVMT